MTDDLYDEIEKKLTAVVDGDLDLLDDMTPDVVEDWLKARAERARLARYITHAARKRAEDDERERLARLRGPARIAAALNS